MEWGRDQKGGKGMRGKPYGAGENIGKDGGKKANTSIILGGLGANALDYEKQKNS